LVKLKLKLRFLFTKYLHFLTFGVCLKGGTADITVHKVEVDQSLCEVHGPSGGSWGGIKVLTYQINDIIVAIYV